MTFTCRDNESKTTTTTTTTKIRGLWFKTTYQWQLLVPHLCSTVHCKEQGVDSVYVYGGDSGGGDVDIVVYTNEKS